MTEKYADIPRPGDADFEAFPKHLPDDCIQYTVHILTSPPLSPSALRSRLLEFQRAATDLIKLLLRDYIWQREAFILSLINALDQVPAQTSKPQSSHHPWHLAGSTSFGDSIADEWLIVYILRELSKTFTDAWVRVVDADGEFLLVEAANALPRWLNPEVAEHRVWINKGQLRIIPREEKDAKPTSRAGKSTMNSTPRQLSLQQALAYISTSQTTLIHSPIIEEEAFYRIRAYPTAIPDSFHTARISIPRNLAYILHQTPAHISPAVEAFYLRDPISLRPLQGKSSAGLRFPPQDRVTVSVKFTRVGYAQVRSQEFAAPRAWMSALDGTSADREREEMGMRVACAFEMLVADPQSRDKRSVREIVLLLEDLQSGEVELPSDTEIKTWTTKEDDEKWLDVNFADFERELDGKKGKAQGTKDGSTGGFGDKAAQENLRRMVERFEQFLNDDDAGAEGAEFSSDEMDDDDEEEDEEEDPEEDRAASFDEDEFSRMMKEMMGMPTDAETVPHDDLSGARRVQELNADDESEDEEDMQQVMRRMEEELLEAGALNLDVGDQGSGPSSSEDPQYLMAKNLLESFAGQGGAAGPTGNLMASLGYRLPRDSGK